MRTSRHIQRRATSFFEFGLPSPPWMAYTFAKNMKIIAVCFIASLKISVCADTIFETNRGISTTMHDVSPLPSSTKQALLDGREPTKEEQEQTKSVGRYVLRWTSTLPDNRKDEKGFSNAMFTLRIWDPIDKRFPGWNAPIVEILSGAKLLSCQELPEVGWALDVWSTSHKDAYLYIKTQHRHRFANGEYIYTLNPETHRLEYKGVHFSKDELTRENNQLKEALKHMSK
jgi:hypothetical protein